MSRSAGAVGVDLLDALKAMGIGLLEDGGIWELSCVYLDGCKYMFGPKNHLQTIMTSGRTVGTSSILKSPSVGWLGVFSGDSLSVVDMARLPDLDDLDGFDKLPLIPVD